LETYAYGRSQLLLGQAKKAATAAQTPAEVQVDIVSHKANPLRTVRPWLGHLPAFGAKPCRELAAPEKT